MYLHQYWDIFSTFYDTTARNIAFSFDISVLMIHSWCCSHVTSSDHGCLRYGTAQASRQIKICTYSRGYLHQERGKFTCRKGSLMPDTSCSGEYPDMIRFFRILTNCGTSYKKTNNRTEKETYHNILCRSQIFYFSSSTFIQHCSSLSFKANNFLLTVAASQTHIKSKGVGIFIYWGRVIWLKPRRFNSFWGCEIKTLIIQKY